MCFPALYPKCLTRNRLLLPVGQHGVFLINTFISYMSAQGERIENTPQRHHSLSFTSHSYTILFDSMSSHREVRENFNLGYNQKFLANVDQLAPNNTQGLLWRYIYETGNAHWPPTLCYDLFTCLCEKRNWFNLW